MLYTNRPYLAMHRQCLLRFNCQSATCIKMSLHSIIFKHYFILFLTIAMSAYNLISSVFVMLKLPYLNYSKSLAMLQFSTFLRDLLAKRNLCTAAARESCLAAKWYWLHYDEAQDAVFCFCALCLRLHFKDSHYLIQLPCMHETARCSTSI